MFPEQARYIRARYRVQLITAGMSFSDDSTIEQRDCLVLKSGYWKASHELRESELALLDFGARVVLPAIEQCSKSATILHRGCPIIYRASVLELLAMWGDGVQD